MIDKVQNVDIYLDPYATLPTLSYLFDFFKHKEDKERIRLFGLKRFSIPDDIKNLYSEGKIRFVKIMNLDQTEFNNEFNKLFLEGSILNFTFHLNLSHSWKLFTPLLEIMNSNPKQIGSVKVHLYDDGSEGAINLYKIRKSDVDIDAKISEMKSITNIHQLNKLDNPIKIYLWDIFYDAKYHFLETKELSEEKFIPLIKAMPNYDKINLDAFNELSKEDRNLYLKVVDVSSELIQTIDKLKDNDIFLFTGTTIFDNRIDIQEKAKKIHITAINNYINPQGKFFIGEGFKLVIKGHPNSNYINNGLRQHFSESIHLPENVPYEILYLLGLRPNKIGGFASTSYFSQKRESIADIIFLTDLNTDFNSNIDTEFDLFKSQKNLMETMINLNIVDRKNTHSYMELFNS
ncbi:hypothetical protein ACWIUH_08005 [Ursidibacter arcticus]